jgi:hypothetical protein
MFGRQRKDDEDPFAALKDGGTYQSTPMTVPSVGDSGLGADPPVGHAVPPPPVVRTPSSRVRSRGSGYGPQIWLRVASFGIIAAVALAVPLLTAHHASHSTFSVPSFNFGGGSPTSPTPHAVHVNYLTPHALGSGLARIEKLAPGARVSLLRIDDHSLSVTAVPRHGRSKLIYFGPTGTFVTPTSSTGQVPVAISQIRPGVIRRLVAGMRSRFHVPPRRIDYIVLSSPQGSGAHWVLFTKAPSRTGYIASVSGGGLARIP